MTIITTVTFSAFRDAFRAYNRADTFTEQGTKDLFAYLEDYSEDCGTPVELDVIALCCAYEEQTLDELIRSYAPDVDLADYEDDSAGYYEAVITWLAYRTFICSDTSNANGDTSIVYACF
jgi:hypothetical protein